MFAAQAAAPHLAAAAAADHYNVSNSLHNFQTSQVGLLGRIRLQVKFLKSLDYRTEFSFKKITFANFLYFPHLDVIVGPLIIEMKKNNFFVLLFS